MVIMEKRLSKQSLPHKSHDLKFSPQKLSDQFLDRLWILAERRGDRAFQEEIEAEIFERLETEL